MKITSSVEFILVIWSISTVVFLFCLPLAVDLAGIEANDTKEGQIMIGEDGVQIAKNISRHVITAVDDGSLSLNISGTVFITNRTLLNISEPKPSCANGQTFRDGYCCKYLTNSFHFANHLFSNRSQMRPECGKIKNKVAHETRPCVSRMF